LINLEKLIQQEQKGKKQTKNCKGWVAGRLLTNQEHLASEQRREELKHQTYLRNKEKGKKTYIDKRVHINNTCRDTDEDLQGLDWT
jgi:hypothetical protein